MRRLALVFATLAAAGTAQQTAQPTAQQPAQPRAQQGDARPEPRFEPPPPSFAFLTAPPAGLPAMPLPVDYAPTAAMFALGERLFHDGILSRDRTIACANCHAAATGYANPEPRPRGIGGQLAKRHAPALWNRGYGTAQRWDGSTPSLEAFVLEPFADAREMDLDVDAAIARLAADDDYRRAFAAAFGAEPSRTALQRALATFVRGIVAGDAPYDRFVHGRPDALSPQQRHGLWIFESKGGCWRCHTPPLFTDERFHNTGVGFRPGTEAAPAGTEGAASVDADAGAGANAGADAERGRAAVTGDAADLRKWKTPTLRGLRLTAPYMHDGSIASLAEVVAFYAQGGGDDPHRDPRLRALELSEADRDALVAFLRSL